jgi:beta-glucosidase
MVFPAGFLWGVSTAAYQIEGGGRANRRGPSAWDKFTSKPGPVVDGTRAHPGSDHYARWAQDVALMRELGVTAYRFSLDWCRIQPEGRGWFNQDGLDHYSALVDALLEAGIQPILCMLHNDLPLPLHDRGGWTNRDTALRFCDYAERTGRFLGDRCRWMALLDQPALLAWQSQVSALHPPAESSEGGFVAALHHQLIGHGLAAQALRAHDGGVQIGVINTAAPVWPIEPEGDNDEAADILKQILIDSALAAQWHGRYPPVLREPMKAVVREGDMETIAQPVDWLGITYPGPLHAARTPGAPFGASLAPPRRGLPLTGAGEVIDAEGLRDLLVAIARDFDMPPLLVTGIGAGYPENKPGPAEVADRDRIAVLRDLIAATGEAIDQGADVRGLLVWTLLDGFAWEQGYAMRHGLVRVNTATQVRVPKASFGWYREVIGCNGDRLD